MGYRFIKQLEAVEYNRKLFYLDRGAIDLPPIIDFTSICPGSESRSLTTGEKWILNNAYKWVYIGTGCCCCCTGGNGSGNNGGNGGGDGDVPTPGQEPTINGVTITPQNITAGLGAQVAFMAQIDGDSKMNQGITWTIKGQNSVNTTISADGILTIAANERSKNITVRATSQGDTTKYAQAVVTVDPYMENPLAEQITGITITPRDIEVVRGRKALLTATITGANITNRGVIWEISGQTSANTTISEDGLLSTASDELSRLIIVKAYAAGNRAISDQTTVSTVTEQDAKNPALIATVKVVPDEVNVAVGGSTKFAAIVTGEFNPPLDVVWKINGATDPNTRITNNGLLIIGDNEKPGLMTIEAISVFDPDKFGEADVMVIGKDDPRYPDLIGKTSVTGVIVRPENVEVPENTLKIFSAIVIGNNDPSQAVTWELVGANVQTTYITDQGVVVVGRGETAKILEVHATSVQDPTKVGIAYIKVTEPTFEPSTGIEDVPKAPLGARYARQRLANGESAWVQLPDEEVDGPIEPDPEIRDIDIDPETITVAPGSVITYAVNMATVGDLSQEVIWTIRGNDSPATNITQDGILYIADDETSKLITVRATSVLDDTKYGRATVAVDEDAALVTLVTGIKIIPADAEIIRGRGMRFQAIQTGVNLTNQNVRWTLAGNANPGTTISQNGTLTVDKNESSSVLLVTVTSIEDPTKSATAVVAVIPEELAENVWKIETMAIIPAEAVVGQGKTQRFAVVISGINNPPQDVIWEVTDAEDIETHISLDGVLYCGDEESENRMLHVKATAVYDPSATVTADVTVVAADDPRVQDTTVDSMIVTPQMVDADKGQRITFTATVIGQNNPSQKVTWSIAGQRSGNTLINNLGVLTIALDETAKVITVTAQSVADPTKTVSAFVSVSDKSVTDPKEGIPEIPEAPLGADYVRSRDESGKAMWKKVDSIQGKDGKDGKDGVDGKDGQDGKDGKDGQDGKDGLDGKDGKDGQDGKDGKDGQDGKDGKDGQDGKDGKDGEDGHDGYLGTFETVAEALAFELPEGVRDGDFLIVNRDEYHNNFPTIYTVKDGSLVFDVLLGRPFILGDKLDVLYVLDNEVHSKYLKDIEVLDDFDTNDKRWDLHESESAWKLVTELHKGFWNMIRHNPDRYKAIVGMNRHTGEVNLYMTCFTDDREFVLPVKMYEVENPRPIDSTLRWTNTVASGNTFTVSNDEEFIQYRFNSENFTLEIITQNAIPSGTEPGVTPWATVIGEYTLLKNGDVIGPLKDVTDPTGYVWVSNREHFMIGSAGNGSQMFCYNIDDDTSFIFDTPNGAKADYQLATDINERYFMMFINAYDYVWVDRKTGESKIDRWKPTGYSGLSTPTSLTRPSISVDGKYYLHTSTNQQTPAFSRFSFETNDFENESPNRGTSSSSIGLSDGKRVATNTPQGEISVYDTNDAGEFERIYNETPYAARYVVVPTGYGNQLLYVKVEAKDGCPAWYVFDCDSLKVTSESKFTDRYCEQTNPQGKGCSYTANSAAGPRYLLTFAEIVDAGLIIERDMAQEGVWTEYELPFGGLGNDKHNYNQPLILEDGTILVTNDSTGAPRGYDMVNHGEIDLSMLPDAPSIDGDNNLVQIDDNHFAWCTGHGTWFYRVRDNVWTLILEIPEQQSVVLGFDTTGAKAENP